MISHSEFELLFSRQEIKGLVTKIARSIEDAYAPDEMIYCIGVLKGAFVFMSDLVREIKRPLRVDFIRAESYGAGTSSSGTVRILKDIEFDVTNKNIVIVEELIDTGRTINFIKARLANSNACSIKVAALMDKPERRELPCQADYLGVTIPDKFVVGYGLDWAEDYRYLPEIYAVPERLIHKK